MKELSVTGRSQPCQAFVSDQEGEDVARNFPPLLLLFAFVETGSFYIAWDALELTM